MGQAHAQGAMLRSKAKWVEQAEHNTKYFFSLEKRNAKNKTMLRLKDDHDILTKDQTKILEIQSLFYEKLYTHDPMFCCKLDGEPPVKINNDEREQLDSEITMEELQNAIKTWHKKSRQDLLVFQ